MTQQSIGRDVACARCGYNLRGLQATGQCPECAYSVAESLAAPDLASQEPRWLRRVRAGLWIQMCVLDFDVFYTSLWFAIFFRLRPFAHLYAFFWRGPTHVVVAITWLIADLIAVWLIATPAPTEAYSMNPRANIDASSEGLTIRQFLRFFACFSFLGGLASVLGSPERAGFPSLFYWIRYAIDFTMIFLFFAFIEKRLAPMARLPSIARQAGILKSIKPLVDVGLIVLTHTAYSTSRINLRDEMRLHAFREVLHIILCIWAIVLLFALVLSFRRALPVAPV